MSRGRITHRLIYNAGERDVTWGEAATPARVLKRWKGHREHNEIFIANDGFTYYRRRKGDNDHFITYERRLPR